MAAPPDNAQRAARNAAARDSLVAAADVESMRIAHRDSWPMGNSRHGTPESPDWGTFCLDCKQSWPCEVAVLIDHIDQAKADAWDEGYYRGIRDAELQHHAENPYRQEADR